jgi:hypothetical protein
MTRFNPRKFTDPDWLGTISPRFLTALLQPWQDYLAQRGFEFPPHSTDCIDCEALATILMSPDANSPVDMLDALYYVHETCAAEDVEALRSTARGRGLVLNAPDDAGAADIVVQVWLADSDLIMDRHAEVLARHQRNFEFFAGRTRLPFPTMDDTVSSQIEAAFDIWFAAHRRGRGCRLLVFRDERTVWILIRHGRGMKRELSHVDDGTSETQIYRPQQHDVLIYDEASGEIGVHATTKGERKLYLRVLGDLLFADEEHFSSGAKFTLAPLIEDGVGSLQCADIEGVESVRLIEYRQYWGAQFKETETRRATDIFAALARRGLDRLPGPEPAAATFMIRFSDSPKERRVAIRLPSSARYDRSADSELVEHWLALRGFVTKSSEARDHGRAIATEVLGNTGIATGLGD